jgi:hypothetical protein
LKPFTDQILGAGPAPLFGQVSHPAP